MDSNHRSRRRRIYSPLHLTALQPTPSATVTGGNNILLNIVLGGNHCDMELVVGIEPTTG